MLVEENDVGWEDLEDSFASSRPRLTSLNIHNFRSFDGNGATLDFGFYQSTPLVLIGENNSGKSNILQAILHLFGDRWPGTWRPEGHDHFRRDPLNPIQISATLQNGPLCYRNHPIDRLHIKSDVDEFFFFGCTHLECNGSRRPNSTMRDRIYAIEFGPNSRIDYQLSYSSQWTMLSKLMREFHNHLVSDPNREEKLRSIFDQTIAVFDEVTEFKNFKDELTSVSRMLAQSMQYALEFDFSAYDPSNFFRSLRIYPSEDQTVRSFEELGSGQKQILMLAFVQAYADTFKNESSLILVCDEPETHLHPSAQQLLSNRLKQTSRRTGIQVVIATHSPYFVDLANVESLVKVSKHSETGSTRILQHSDNTFSEELNHRGNTRSSQATPMYYESQATIERKSALFARIVVLVEGESEQLALPTFIAKAAPEYDPANFGAFFVLVGGEGELAKWSRFYQVMGIPVFILADSDGWKAKRIPSLEKGWNSVHPETYQMPGQLTASTPAHIAGNMCILSGAFEAFGKALLRDRWVELEKDAIELLGDEAVSKRFRAKYIAENLQANDFSVESVALLTRLGKSISEATILAIR